MYPKVSIEQKTDMPRDNLDKDTEKINLNRDQTPSQK
jgi:hypothetical protein